MTFYNYWVDRITFKEKLDDELVPLLKKYVGEKMTIAVADKIKKEAHEFVNDKYADEYILIPFQINLECDELTTIITNISVILKD